MKRAPFFIIIGTLVVLSIYLLPKVFSLVLAILMAGVIPGTSLSISPLVMFLGALVGGGLLLHRLHLLDFKTPRQHANGSTAHNKEGKTKKTQRPRRRFAHAQHSSK